MPEQRLFFVLGDGGLGFEGEAGAAAAARVEGVVVDALRDEDDVRQAEVDADGDGGRGEVGCEGACLGRGG